MLYVAEGMGTTRMQVGLTPEQKAELGGYTLVSWKAQQRRLAVRRSRGTSPYIGVRRRGIRGSWRVQASTSTHIVRRNCATEELAAAAYDRLMLEDQGRCVLITASAF